MKKKDKKSSNVDESLRQEYLKNQKRHRRIAVTVAASIGAKAASKALNRIGQERYYRYASNETPGQVSSVRAIGAASGALDAISKLAMATVIFPT